MTNSEKKETDKGELRIYARRMRISKKKKRAVAKKKGGESMG